MGRKPLKGWTDNLFRRAVPLRSCIFFRDGASEAAYSSHSLIQPGCPTSLGHPWPSSSSAPIHALSHFSLCAFVYPHLMLLLTIAQPLYRLSSFSLHPYKGGIGILYTRLLKTREVGCLS